ncbi:MAG: Na+/H+ antiporter family protein [Tepidibacter sp.]|nr:Na+/H+ antiporter family protein [Tepidibacter sp.]MCT4509371.1 Na+/H+ antiporter family protein [Tepidibacter sp.]
MMITNPVVISVILMTVLCLIRLNVILSLIISAISAGILSGISIDEIMNVFINGMGGNTETALSYILLGALACAINKTGLADILARKIAKLIKGKSVLLVILIAAISIFSQNLIPVHIAFIPILIPPLLGVMNNLKIDRRAVACSLTFGLQMPYMCIPAGFGLIFHNIIRDQMNANGMNVYTNMIWKAMILPGIGMVIGLVVAVFISYRKPREYTSKDICVDEIACSLDEGMSKKHYVSMIAALSALIVQLKLGSLPLGALVGIIIIVLFRAIKWRDIDDIVSGGIKTMGFIAFVMLVASGYGAVIRATGGVEALVQSGSILMGSSKLIAATTMILLGLIITIGIGTSFGTIPIIAAIYVPLASSMGFSSMATIILIGTAAALGDAGSPASDSTLGPTSGLNVDNQHDHIWDTCVPTFLHYNIPLILFGIMGALIF